MTEAFQTPLTERRRLPGGRALLASLAIHGLGLGILVALSLVEPPKLPPVQKPVSARLVRLGIKRDKHLLPRKEVAAPPPPAASAAPHLMPVPIKARDPAPPSTQGPPRDEKTSRSRLFDAFAKTAEKAEPLPGEPDGDPLGDVSDAEEGERYFGLVLAKAKRNYRVTQTISPQELVRLKTVVVLYIGTTGSLLKPPEIQLSSGNEQFDQDVLMSLRKAAPFGPPPAHLVVSLRTVGVAIEARP